MHSTLRPRANECTLMYDHQVYRRIPIFMCRRKPECLEKTYQGGYGYRQTKFTYIHWLAALVKGKCSSTKPTHLATGVVCHPHTEQNRPYKIPCSCRGLNRGPTALQARTLPVCQARTLPVCHTTPICCNYKSSTYLINIPAA